jgi:NAD dependent epimerase/dehydratase family enzyme
MHILIIGGRQFLGRAIIEEAIKDGHVITMFNRGKTHPEYAPEGVNIILGDRVKELHLLDNLQVDCIIDTCGYIPSIVEQHNTFRKELRYIASSQHCPFMMIYQFPMMNQAEEPIVHLKKQQLRVRIMEQ